VGLSPVKTRALALAKRHGLAVGPLRLAQDHQEQTTDQHKRQDRAQNGQPTGHVARGRDL
jgi:hypothetical protein